MKPFVLVVDDSLTVRMDLRQALAGANFAVAACGTLATARQVLKSRACDLAVLDILLPDGSGADLLREIKEDPELRHIPVIVLSVTARSTIETSGEGIAAEGYVGKPYDSMHLVKLAEGLCSANMGGRRFLIVDDSPTFVAAMSGYLRQYGNDVVCATSGEEALSLLQQQTVDCVILDMVMPGIGGLETCRRLRQLTGLRDLPVVMLTASENTSGRSQRSAIGADEFLIKSHRIDLLCAQIRSLLRRKPRTVSSATPAIEGPSSLPSPATGKGLNEQIMSLLGLSKSVARLVLTRSCRSAGIESDTVTPESMPRFLQALRDNLSMFLPPAQLAQRVDAVRALTAPAERKSALA